MSDAVMGTDSALSVIVPQIWSQRYYDVLLADLPFNSVISKDYEGEIQALGDTVKISTVPQFSEAEETSELDRVDAESVTVTQQSLTINKQLAKDFIITNKAMLQSLPVMDKLRELAVYSINKKIQSLIIAAIVPSASSPDHQISYDSGSTLQLADILEAKELLDTQSVAMPDRHVCLGAAQLNDVFNISQLSSADYVAMGLMETGMLSKPILGFVPHFCAAAGNVSYFFHSSFMTMAAQKGLTVEQFNLGVDGKRAARVNVTTLMGLKQLSNIRVVTIS